MGYTRDEHGVGTSRAGAGMDYLAIYASGCVNKSSSAGRLLGPDRGADAALHRRPALDANVTVLAPFGTPRILDGKVVEVGRRVLSVQQKCRKKGWRCHACGLWVCKLGRQRRAPQRIKRVHTRARRAFRVSAARVLFARGWTDRPGSNHEHGVVDGGFGAFWCVHARKASKRSARQGGCGGPGGSAQARHRVRAMRAFRRSHSGDCGGDSD